MEEYFIDPDIAKAESLPPSFYRSDVFLTSWQYIGDASSLPFANHVYPFTLLDGFLTEPMVMVKDEEEKIHCLSNVCTHRGNLVVQTPGKKRKLICNYHGRQFAMDGSFEKMPEFKEAENFPRDCEGLHEFRLARWGSLLFVGLNGADDIDHILSTMKDRVGFLDLDQFNIDSTLSREYLVQANWALYCDNYLEGFHIPFVHQDLSDALDYGKYKSELYEGMTLQIGYADSGVESFDLPSGHPDEGEEIAAYYYWVFPNMMFNFYPWGLSLNIVKPISLNRTKVSFISYVLDPSKLDSGAGAVLDKVEREDEFVVEGVQKGVASNFYKSGRFSPTREKGVHHFHQMLARAISQ
jgi:choline monooxygenase